MVERDDSCPCGSGSRLADCCGRYLAGEPAPTAEALMRSRYTAYVLGAAGYLADTWRPDRRPDAIELEAGPRWLGLEVLAVSDGGRDDGEGRVEFVARYMSEGRPGALHEVSRFVREAGRWYYVDGSVLPVPTGDKVGRNTPCPCGSGRKFKRCCGAKGGG